MVDRVIRRPQLKTIAPGPRTGQVLIPSSKSQLHRLLICAALGEEPVEIACRSISEDIRATADCLNALGAKISTKEADAPGGTDLLAVEPLDRSFRADGAVLDCGESGSTLRFLLPVIGILGANCLVLRRGRLPERPLAPYDAQLEANGMRIDGEGSHLTVSGRLSGGEFVLPGNISSQYVSGLLMALGALRGQSRLRVEGPMESSHYVEMTEAVLTLAGIRFEKDQTGTDADPRTVWTVDGGQTYALPQQIRAEGDWSSATFFLCMGALSEEGVLVQGLDPASVQGDRAVLDVLKEFGTKVGVREDGVLVRKGLLRGIDLDASQIPDAVPALAALAALCEGTTHIYNAGRLRLKESDRIRSTMHMLRSLGGIVTETEDGLIIHGRPHLDGGTVDPAGDHRIAMAAAVAACGCIDPVQVGTYRCVAKSYPDFWDDLEQLKVEA
ncbi:MAG: 3-phosphoshikimate 1-carboxyvinyltransferase [Firmicutes bacterium]|nr:3-phosphoshikimate 1-carboxyvinyltransferase [Bacillota bacterium]